MAELNHLGNVRARCPGCKGALSTYEWSAGNNQFGAVRSAAFRMDPRHSEMWINEWRLLRCAGCGRGGMVVVRMGASSAYGGDVEFLSFTPEVLDQLPLPAAVPKGIVHEFREAEHCLGADCVRAAAGMFRSVLDKTLRANGYKVKAGTTLEQQIDMAAADGVITMARKLRAHEDIRVLGNDVLHDEWHPISQDDVLPARHYAQRILEDLYDDRQTVLQLLQKAGRVADEHKTPPPPSAAVNALAALAPSVAGTKPA